MFSQEVLHCHVDVLAALHASKVHCTGTSHQLKCTTAQEGAMSI